MKILNTAILLSILSTITYFGYLSLQITGGVLELIGHLFFLN